MKPDEAKVLEAMMELYDEVNFLMQTVTDMDDVPGAWMGVAAVVMTNGGQNVPSESEFDTQEAARTATAVREMFKPIAMLSLCMRGTMRMRLNKDGALEYSLRDLIVAGQEAGLVPPDVTDN
jgi:hypothetical protein